MPAEFRKLGIAFQYPENWTLDDSEAQRGNPSVTVISPGGGFWTVSIHPRTADPLELANSATAAIREEYAELEVEEARESMEGWELVGYNLCFYYLDLISTASVRCLRTNQATYSIFFQAEDRELARIEPVFRAMTTSFLQELSPPKRWESWMPSIAPPE